MHIEIEKVYKYRFSWFHDWPPYRNLAVVHRSIINSPLDARCYTQLGCGRHQPL